MTAQTMRNLIMIMDSTRQSMPIVITIVVDKGNNFYQRR
jgi:hypothetical protein